MTMSWLMTVQEAGISPPGRAGVAFALTPRWMSSDPGFSDELPPNPNLFGTLRHWPRAVEIRRPDGTQVNAEASPRSVHFNFPYNLGFDAAGRIRNPWIQHIVLRGVNVEEVPPGSEFWGEIPDEEVQTSKGFSTDQLGK